MTALGAPSGRASDVDRETVVRLLQDALVDGRLSQDSFVNRVGSALQARDRASLAQLLDDLRDRENVVERLRAGLAVLFRDPGSAARALRLSLPDRRHPVLLIGRRADCDVVVRDTTVSRRHAAVMLFGDSWFILDHGSTNGTWVNERRIWGASAVRVGDRLMLGRMSFRLASPSAVVSPRAS